MLRWRDQTTRPRHRITDIAIKPRMAPTIIKTVPSGRFDCCINGASAVGGTEGATITKAPLRVGKLVAPELSPDEPAPVIVGTLPVAEEEEEEPPPVIVTELEDELELDEGVLDVLDVWPEDWDELLEAEVCDEDDFEVPCVELVDEEDPGRLGRPDDVPAAETATASRPTPAARERRRDCRENLMA
jgi:hypothetical protein